MRCVFLFFAGFLAINLTVQAQTATVTKMKVPLAGTVVLEAVEDKYNAEVYNLEMPEPDADEEQEHLMELKEAVARRFPHKKIERGQWKVTAALPPVVAINYIADSNSGIPPDNDMAISKANISVSVVNSAIVTHDATTGAMQTRKGLKSFSNVVGLNNLQADYRYDPKIIYDPQADRFICVMLNGTNDHNWIILAFSKTNDPAGAWNFYKFYGDFAGDTTWFDYPSIAITNNEFFLTGNKIRFNTSWQAGFKETVIYQINKQSGYNGDANLNMQLWQNIGYNGANIRNLYPVKGGGNIYGPEQYFLSNRNFDVQNDTIFLVKIPDTIGSANTTLSITALKSNLAYGVPPDGRQIDTAYTLATNDGRILGAYREGSEIQFVSTTVHPVSGSAAVYHGRITGFSGSPSIQANYFMVDTLDFGYPNLSFAGNYSGANHSIISFNFTGPSTHAGLGAIYFDGTQFSDLTVVKTGDSTIKVLQQKQQRWGDYMGNQPDWNYVGGVVWIEGIYGRKNRNYGDWIARLASPYYTGVVNLPQHETKGAVFPNPAFQFITADFELATEAKVSFAIFDAQGRLVDRVSDNSCEPGKNRVRLNVAALANGIYFLRATDEGGRQVLNKRFLKQ